MKTCSGCGTSNPDTANFCNACGASLSTVAPDVGEPVSSPTSTARNPEAARKAKERFERRKGGPAKEEIRDEFRDSPPPEEELFESQESFSDALSHKWARASGRQVDIMFVLDCTESMRGEISAIKDAIASFADTIQSEGVRARVGLIEFRDRLIHEEHRVITFNGNVFTDDPSLFRQQIDYLRASGGGDIPESSLDALMLALRQPFGADRDKAIVLVTDAPPHLPDQDTQEIAEVQQAIKAIKLNQLHLVINAKDKASDIYLQLLTGVKGHAIDLGQGDDFRRRAEDFKKSLMSLGKTISVMTT
jgi:Mg-chelatase subunit ChlD